MGFLSFINLHQQSRARKAKYTLLIYDLVISKKRLKKFHKICSKI